MTRQRRGQLGPASTGARDAGQIPTMFLDGRQVDIATLTTDGSTSQIAEAGTQ